MTPELEQTLIETIARLDERSKFYVDHAKELDAKLDHLNRHVLKSNSEIIADIISLEINLKKQVTDSTADLKKYHDDDLSTLKDNLMVRLGKHKTIVIILGVIILFTFWDRITQTINHKVNDYGIKSNEFNIVQK